VRYFSYSLRSAIGFQLTAASWVLSATVGCGHVGIDLDGNTPSLVEAGSTDSGSGQEPVPTQPKPTQPKPTLSNSPDPGKSATPPPASATGSNGPVTDGAIIPDSDAGELDASVDDASRANDADAADGDASDAAGDADTGSTSDASGRSDSGVDSDGSVVFDGGTWDGGAWSNCRGKRECDIVCEQSPCNAYCPPGAACAIQVGSVAEVVVQCGAGSTCTVDNSINPESLLTCLGTGQCFANCAAGHSCFLACKGSEKCVLDCGDASECSVDCAESTGCLIRHENPDTIVNLACPGGPNEGLTCSLSVLSCNAECPD